MLKEKLMDIMFYQRCITCKDFVFLINFRVEEKGRVSGTIACPECRKNSAVYFIIKN